MRTMVLASLLVLGATLAGCQKDRHMTFVTTGGGTPPSVTSVAPGVGVTTDETQIAVIGQGLTGASALRIGPLVLRIDTVVSDSHVLARVPAGLAPGPYDLAVETPGGSAVGLRQFTSIAGDPVGAASLAAGGGSAKEGRGDRAGSVFFDAGGRLRLTHLKAAAPPAENAPARPPGSLEVTGAEALFADSDEATDGKLDGTVVADALYVAPGAKWTVDLPSAVSVASVVVKGDAVILGTIDVARRPSEEKTPPTSFILRAGGGIFVGSNAKILASGLGSPLDAGDIVLAGGGDIHVFGVLDAAGGPGSAGGSSGGSIALLTDGAAPASTGDIVIGAGAKLLAGGGVGILSAPSAGSGGTIRIAASDGGVDFHGLIDASGGDSASEAADSTAGSARTVAIGTAGGSIVCAGSIAASGGTHTGAGHGGRGGTILLSASGVVDMSLFNPGALDFFDSAPPPGGDGEILVSGLATIDLSGGSSGKGGDGSPRGGVFVAAANGQAAEVVPAEGLSALNAAGSLDDSYALGVKIVASGGSATGDGAGGGGGVVLFVSAGNLDLVGLDVDASGGGAIGDQQAGGAGLFGAVSLSGDTFLSGSIRAGGGSTSGGGGGGKSTAGAGGLVALRGFFGAVNSASTDAGGGASQGALSAGEGGRIEVYGRIGPCLNMGALTANGGACNGSGSGGPGGEVVVQGGGGTANLEDLSADGGEGGLKPGTGGEIALIAAIILGGGDTARNLGLDSHSNTSGSGGGAVLAAFPLVNTGLLSARGGKASAAPSGASGGRFCLLGSPYEDSRLGEHQNAGGAGTDGQGGAGTFLFGDAAAGCGIPATAPMTSFGLPGEVGSSAPWQEVARMGGAVVGYQQTALQK